jgi:hypothetical protein
MGSKLFSCTRSQIQRKCEGEEIVGNSFPHGSESIINA